MTTASVNSQLAGQGESLSATSGTDIEKITSILLPSVGAIDTDNQYVSGLKGVSSNDGAPTYMGAISPWFFTHYGQNSFNKNVSLSSPNLSLSLIMHEFSGSTWPTPSTRLGGNL